MVYLNSQKGVCQSATGASQDSLGAYQSRVERSRCGAAVSFRLFQCLLILVVFLVPTTDCVAEHNVLRTFLTWPSDLEVRRSYLYSSFFTTHYDPDPDHVNDQNLIGFEAQLKNRRVMGLAVFDNSFGQKSEYAYIGEHWSPFTSEKFYLKLTGGLLHGYKGKYEDKIPLNNLGIAPAIVPTVGYRTKNFVAEFNQLGVAAAMITAGFTF